MGSREVGLTAEESLSWSSKKKRKVVRMTPGPLGSQPSMGRRCQPGRYNSTAGGPDRNLHPRDHPEALSLQWETGQQMWWVLPCRASEHGEMGAQGYCL